MVKIMEKFELCCPCLFGLEGLVGDELRRMGMDDVRAETGRVLFRGGKNEIIKANMGLYTAERVLIELGRFEAASFDELFEGVKALEWESVIPKDGKFPVKGHALNSKLMSVPDCQRIIKKSVAERLGQKYGLTQLPETGAVFQIQFSIMKDEAVLYIDTSGAGLHKRGWRASGNVAPLRETLAAGMVRLSRYRGREQFFDPFCGSGTIAIEAALAALNRAPGLSRHFSAMDWPGFEEKLWNGMADELRSKEYSGDYHIFASDIDPKCVETARHNAELAGVSGHISFSVGDARAFAPSGGGVLVINPPYGERLMEKREAEALYRDFGRAFSELEGFKAYILSGHPGFEAAFGRPADKKRKLYNGMIKCDLYMYL